MQLYIYMCLYTHTHIVVHQTHTVGYDLLIWMLTFIAHPSYELLLWMITFIALAYTSVHDLSYT